MHQIVLLILCALFNVSFGITYYINCGNCDNIERNNSGKCKVKIVYQEIYPSSNETTAHQPFWENTSWYIYQKKDNSLAIAFNLSWSQTGNQFLQTKGYLLSITRTASDGSKFRQFFVDLFKKKDLTPIDKVIMNYPCYGREHHDSLDPKHSYSLKMRSLPAYHIGTDHRINEINRDIYIDCEDKKIQGFRQCQDDYSYYLSDYGSYEHYIDLETTTIPVYKRGAKESTVVFAVVIASCLLFIVFLFIIITGYLKTIYFKSRFSVMLLISTCGKEDDGDHKYLKAADILSDMLKQLGNLNVISNVWNDINVSDPLNWFDENVKICKHIILICTPLGKKNWIKNNTNDLFVMGFKMLRKQRIKKRWFSSNSHDFSVIYFDDDSTLCIPDEMIKDNIKHKNVLNNLRSFFSKVTSKKLNTNLESVVSFKTAVNLIHSNSLPINSETFLLNEKSKKKEDLKDFV